MGVSEEALSNWENGICEPHVRLFPKVIVFLGYEPWDEATTFGERLIAERRRRGLSVKRAALLLGVDEGTFAKWEGEGRMPRLIHRLKCEEFIRSSAS